MRAAAQSGLVCLGRGIATTSRGNDMANPLLGQILASALGGRAASNQQPTQPGQPGGFGGLSGGLGGVALGGLLAGLAGRRGGRPAGNRGLLLAMMLPLAMRWVQQNGGIGAVLDRFRQHGLGSQADSWVSTGQNRGISPQEVQKVVGNDEIGRFAAQLGVPEQEVSQAFAEILPELTDKLTPEGSVPPQAGAALDQGRSELERTLGELHADMQHLG
jgi:uncharacterized protein YidB (DUF937 family)